MAPAEASESQAAEAESVGPSRAAMVSGLLEDVRAQLQEMRADDEEFREAAGTGGRRSLPGTYTGRPAEAR